MARFDNYLNDVKKQTDTLRDVVSEKSGVDCSDLSISGVAEVVKDIQAGGKDPVLQEKSVDPKTYSQEVTADEGYDGLSKLSVGAVTSNIDANITPTNIRAGVSILGVQGNLSSDKPDQTKRVTPKTTEQSVFADAGYELGEVIVEAVTSDIDADIKASNIKRGINILGVDGTFDGGELQSKTVTPTTSEQNVTADTGFYGLSGVKVNAVNPSDYYKDEEIVNVTPSTESQKITATANKVFNEVNVSAVTSAIDSNILADNIKKDVTILGVTGTLEQGGAEDLTAELTAQDEAITRLTLAVDNLGSGEESKELVIDLPSEFADVQNIFVFKFNDNVLISGAKQGIGLWVHSISNNTTTKIYSTGMYWNKFQVVGDKCLISSGSSNDLGILLFDGNTATKLFTSGYNWGVFKNVGDKWLIASTSSKSIGILLYDGETITQLYSSGYYYEYFQEVGNKCLISSRNSSEDCAGLLLFDGNSITKIYDISYGWQYFHIIGDKCLISGAGTDTGILLYDGNTISQLYLTGQNWYYCKEFGGKYLISSNHYQVMGLLLFDGNAITEIYSSGNSWNATQKVGNKLLIGSNSSYGIGVLLFDGSTITQVHSSGAYWEKFQVVGDKCLIGTSQSSSGNSGILLYDGETVTKIYSSGNSWQYFQVVGDKCLIGGSSTSNGGVLLYHNSKITQKYSFGYYWRYFKENADGTIEITSSYSGYTSMILTYNPVDDTIKVTGAKVV